MYSSVPHRRLQILGSWAPAPTFHSSTPESGVQSFLNTIGLVLYSSLVETVLFYSVEKFLIQSPFARDPRLDSTGTQLASRADQIGWSLVKSEASSCVEKSTGTNNNSFTFYLLLSIVINAQSAWCLCASRELPFFNHGNKITSRTRRLLWNSFARAINHDGIH
jgi:hypothetical protein